MKTFLLQLLLCLSLQGLYVTASAQVTFNYDSITICQGDSYDLMKYQTNEVSLPVGWEIVGWKDSPVSPVIPATSPTTYTLQYRELANPSVILTHDLVITLRPKPSVSISPSGKQTACLGSPINITKVSASNYDNLYWLNVQTGDKIYTQDLSAIANLDNGNKMTFKLLATNEDCASLAQAQAEYDIVDVNSFPIIDYFLTYPVNVYTTPKGYIYDYCGNVYLNDYVRPSYLTIYKDLAFSDWGYMHLNEENNYYKLTRYDIKWDNPDMYTLGAPLNGINYNATFTIEADLYFKACGITKTYTEKRFVNLNYTCASTFNFYYFCNSDEQKMYITVNHVNVDTILNFQFINKTLPGQYIPNLDYKGKTSSSFSFDFDDTAPSSVDYDLNITYVDLNGDTLTYNYTNLTVMFCKKEEMISYMASYKRIDNYPQKTCYSLADQFDRCYNVGKGTPVIKKVQLDICKGDTAYLSLATRIGNDYEIVWDNETKPMFIDHNYPTQFVPDTNYTYSLVNGKHNYKFQPHNEVEIAVHPSKTTTYTGTLYGVPFAFNINVNDLHIAATDTAICNGASIDLKTLEDTATILGSATWSVGNNTVVSPVVDTKYLVYGVSKAKCPGHLDYTVTDTVLVKVEAPIWANTVNFTVCKNDSVDLNGGITSNARNIQWFDPADVFIPRGIAKVPTTTTYKAHLTNTCNFKDVTIQISTKDCPVVPQANNDTVYAGSCDSIYSFKVALFKNDSISSYNPSSKLINGSKIPHSTYSLLNDTLSYNSGIIHVPTIDSIQYELTCNGLKDTAMVYFVINKFPNPKINNLRMQNGNVYFNIVGGTPNFTYLLDYTSTSTDSVFYSLKKGNHILTVIDANLCNKSIVFYSYGNKMEVNPDSLNYRYCTNELNKSIYVLDNDTLLSKPIITIITPPTLEGSDAQTYSDHIDYYFDPPNLKVAFLGHNVLYDSIQYEISCDGKKDSAWVYISIKNNELHIENFHLDSNNVSFNIVGGDSPYDYKLIKENPTVIIFDSINNYNPNVSYHNLSLVDGFYQLLVEDSLKSNSCWLEENFEIKNGSIVQTIFANNDYQSFAGCVDSFYVNILNNDHYACKEPIVHLLDNPAFAGAKASLDINNSIIYKPFLSPEYTNKVDSFHYEIICGVQRDTATVFIYYPYSSWGYSNPKNNWFYFNDSIGSQCYKEGNKLVETVEISNTCAQETTLGMDFLFNNPNMRAVLDSSMFIDSTNITVQYVYKSKVSQDYIINIHPGGSFILNCYYTLDSITNGSVQYTILANFSFGNSVYESGWIYNLVKVCPDRDIKFIECNHSKEIDLSQEDVTSYNIISGPKIAGASATLSNDGIFTYYAGTSAGYQQDTIRYRMQKSDLSFEYGIVAISITPCIGELDMDSTQNKSCSNEPCDYKGPKILINEVMIAPINNDDAIYGSDCGNTATVGGEWVELYNPNKCDSVELSNYFFANATIDKAGQFCNTIHGLGASFVIPAGTIVPPMGFCLLRGKYAPLVDSALMVGNGGNVAVINLENYSSQFCMSPGENRFWLPNNGSWFSLYDKYGVPQDAVWWGADSEDICSNCNPCNSGINPLFTGQLNNLDQIPADRKTRITDFDLATYRGNSLKRLPDGGSWAFDSLSLPKMAICNDTCKQRVNPNCNGTATVNPNGGSGDFSYKWNDPSLQTTRTAVGLCEGLYCVTVTDNQTGFKKTSCIAVTNNWKIDTTYLNKSICDKDRFYIFQGDTLRSAGVYEKRLLCDSLLILNFKINPTVRVNLIDSVCIGGTYLFNGKSLKIPGVYIDTLLSVAGCDSIVTLSLKHKIPIITQQYTEICNGSSYSFGGLNISTAGIYIDTLKTSSGCDSIVNLNLKVKAPITKALADSFCLGGSYVYRGHSLTTPGVFLDTLKAVSGCDSVITFTLTNKQTIKKTVNQSICQGSSYPFKGLNLKTGGTYKDTLKTTSGCDSVVTLNLNVNPPLTKALTDSFCVGGSYIYRGKTLTAPGIFIDTLTTALGCDSIVTFTLTQKQPITKTLNQTICQGSTYVFGGLNLKTGGTYKDTLKTASGCDSVTTLNLNVTPPLTKALADSFCINSNYLYRGKDLTIPGVYKDTLSTTFGCDSIVTLTLSNKQQNQTIINVTLKKGESYTFKGKTLTIAGEYRDTLLNAQGCDSILVLNLIDYVEPITIDIPDIFTPNGDGVNDYFEIKNIDLYPKNTILIFNRWGDKVWEGGPYLNNWDGTNMFGIMVGGNKLPVGTYFYILNLGDGSPVRKGYIYLNR